MDYYNDVVYKQEGERSWVTYIKGKVTEENNSFPCMVVGKTGSGKSYGVLRLCQEIDPDFQLEGNWFFRAEEFMKAFTNYYKDRENSKVGKIWVFDEAGVDLNSLKYQNTINKAYSTLFQTSRFRNYIFFGTVPFLDFISKQVRKLMHHRMDAKGIERNKGILVPRCLEWSEKKEDFYEKMLICKYPNGDTKKIKRIMMPLARKKLLQEYEERRRQFSDDVNQELVDEQDDTKDDIPLPPNHQMVIDKIKEGKTSQAIAIDLEMSIENIQRIMTQLKKVGYSFKLGNKMNYIYYPDTKKWEGYPKAKSLNSSLPKKSVNGK